MRGGTVIMRNSARNITTRLVTMVVDLQKLFIERLREWTKAFDADASSNSTKLPLSDPQPTLPPNPISADLTNTAGFSVALAFAANNQPQSSTNTTFAPTPTPNQPAPTHLQPTRPSAHTAQQLTADTLTQLPPPHLRIFNSSRRVSEKVCLRNRQPQRGRTAYHDY